MSRAKQVLNSHDQLNKRIEVSKQKIEIIKREVVRYPILNDEAISIFCTGSIARGEYGGGSDLDLLLAYNGSQEKAKMLEPEVKATLKKINNELGYPPLSDSSKYHDLHTIKDIVNSTGSRLDDKENRFTVRLLMILEGISVNSESLFDDHKRKILKNYFRDQAETKAFLPYFLLNDILRYWRTLCLNYEEFRFDRIRPWRKKSVNLKFSRMLTVFGTVLPLVALPICDEAKCFELTKLRPMERMAYGLDILNSEELYSEWGKILDYYELFLQQKECKGLDKEILDEDEKAMICSHSTTFSDYMHQALTQKNINHLLRKALIL